MAWPCGTECADTFLGSVVVVVGAGALMIAGAYAARGTALAGAVTLSTSYAIGDFFGLKHSLHRSFRDAPGFYTIFAGLVVLAAGIVPIPG
jgi:Mn2+/Fe2+ NRAMP family transporter